MYPANLIVTKRKRRTKELNHKGRGSAPGDEMSRLRYRSSFEMKARGLLALVSSSVGQETNLDLDGEHL